MQLDNIVKVKDRNNIYVNKQNELVITDINYKNCWYAINVENNDVYGVPKISIIVSNTRVNQGWKRFHTNNWGKTKVVLHREHFNIINGNGGVQSYTLFRHNNCDEIIINH